MSFDERHLKDPACFQENRLAAHSDHIAYAGMEELARGESSLRWPLDGLWKFFYARNEDKVIQMCIRDRYNMYERGIYGLLAFTNEQLDVE